MEKIKLLQPLSPECNPRSDDFIPWAEPGRFLIGTTMLLNELTFRPRCDAYRTYIEFDPDGHLVKCHGEDSTVAHFCLLQSTTDRICGVRTTIAGNQLVEYVAYDDGQRLLKLSPPAASRMGQLQAEKTYILTSVRVSRGPQPHDPYRPLYYFEIKAVEKLGKFHVPTFKETA